MAGVNNFLCLHTTLLCFIDSLQTPELADPEKAMPAMPMTVVEPAVKYNGEIIQYSVKLIICPGKVLCCSMISGHGNQVRARRFATLDLQTVTGL